MQNVICVRFHICKRTVFQHFWYSAFFKFLLQIGYWEAYDGTQIRELDGTKSGSINGLDVSPDRMYFVTGGEDRLLKVKCFLVYRLNWLNYSTF